MVFELKARLYFELGPRAVAFWKTTVHFGLLIRTLWLFRLRIGQYILQTRDSHNTSICLSVGKKIQYCTIVFSCYILYETMYIYHTKALLNVVLTGLVGRVRTRFLLLFFFLWIVKTFSKKHLWVVHFSPLGGPLVSNIVQYTSHLFFFFFSLCVHWMTSEAVAWKTNKTAIPKNCSTRTYDIHTIKQHKPQTN